MFGSSAAVYHAELVIGIWTRKLRELTVKPSTKCTTVEYKWEMTAHRALSNTFEKCLFSAKEGAGAELMETMRCIFISNILQLLLHCSYSQLGFNYLTETSV